MSDERFTCPCCGHRTLAEPPGSHNICMVCFWQDDGVQLLDPACRGGANGPCLMECQDNYQRLGAAEERFSCDVRPLQAGESRDPEWRPVQDADLRWARAPRDLSPQEYERVETWYYWKRNAT
ncbi:MAG: CPCC family cysteine-rich protein [Deltaproteobacteria bacterium]|nr:CPCC family cysteine-rich protein [Deltaproteobacteria bacterium]